MRSLISVSLSLLAATLIAACASTPSSPTSSTAAPIPSSAAYTAAQLEGTWTLAIMQPAGAEKQNRPFNATYTLTFTDGRLSTRVDCNQCSGTFSVSGSTLI